MITLLEGLHEECYLVLRRKISLIRRKVKFNSKEWWKC